jgi:hypothetical protein
MIVPERNCAPELAVYSSAFFAAKRSRTSSRRPKAVTTSWPVKASSICAFSWPVSRHWFTNRGCDRFAMTTTIPSVSGIATRASSASSQEIVNIIATTPMTVRTETSACDTVCCRLWEMLSMSLVTRLSSSPRGVESTWESGNRWIVASTSARSRNTVRCTTRFSRTPWT